MFILSLFFVIRIAFMLDTVMYENQSYSELCYALLTIRKDTITRKINKKQTYLNQTTLYNCWYEKKQKNIGRINNIEYRYH